MTSTRRRVQPSLVAVLLVYLALAFGLLAIWGARGWYSPTGDEPHYLVMARGIIESRTFDQSGPIAAEYASPEFLKPEFIPADRVPVPGDLLTVAGSNGWFSVHSIGLPTLLAIPVALGGLVGARIALVLIGAVVVALAWIVAAQFTQRQWVRAGVAFAAVVAMPLIPSATQVYPDLVGGALALLGLTWMLVRRGRSPGAEVALSAAIAFLPWLQLKFIAPTLVIVIGLVWLLRTDGRSIGSLWRVWALPALSLIAVGGYNLYAYGRIAGPYDDGGLVADPTSLMVLLGLHLDQNQGFLLLNPVLFIGVFAIPLMFRRMRAFTIFWALVFLALVLPNAMHPNWYGGGAFFARFGLAGAIVFAVPTIYGLVRLAAWRPQVFWIVVALGALLQLAFYALYGFVHTVDPRSGSGIDLYNPGTQPWLESYSFFWYPLQRLLPAMYDASWAYGYGPNWGWVILTLAVFAAGVVVALGRTWPRRMWWAVGAGVLLLAIVFSQLGSPGLRSLAWDAARLDVRSGTVRASSVTAVAGNDSPGLMLVTPAVQLREGPYSFSIDYSSTAAPDEVVGWWELVDPSANTTVRTGEIHGTAGQPGIVTDTFGFRALAPRQLQYTVGWYPRGAFTVDRLTFAHAPSRVS